MITIAVLTAVAGGAIWLFTRQRCERCGRIADETHQYQYRGTVTVKWCNKCAAYERTHSNWTIADEDRPKL